MLPRLYGLIIRYLVLLLVGLPNLFLFYLVYDLLLFLLQLSNYQTVKLLNFDTLL